MTHKHDEQTVKYLMLSVRDAFTSDKSICTLCTLGKLSIIVNTVFVETINIHKVRHTN